MVCHVSETSLQEAEGWGDVLAIGFWVRIACLERPGSRITPEIWLVHHGQIHESQGACSCECRKQCWWPDAVADAAVYTCADAAVAVEPGEHRSSCHLHLWARGWRLGWHLMGMGKWPCWVAV